MLEAVWPSDLMRGACIYGKGVYELVPSIASKLEKPIVVDVRPWDVGKRYGYEVVAGRLLEWLNMDLMIEGLSVGLKINPGTVGALLNRFYRTTPSPTLFGLSGFLDTFESSDLQMKGVAERVREVVVSLSSLREGGEMPKEGPASIDLSGAGWNAPRCLLYTALLKRLFNERPKVVVVLSGLEVLERSPKLWGLVEGLFERVPVLALSEERPPIDFFTMVKVVGGRFELVRGGRYFSAGTLNLKRSKVEEEGVRGDLSDSREAHMVLKALEKDESTVEGLKGYLPSLPIDEILFVLEDKGYVRREGRFVKITERGLEHLGRLEEIYG